jgi:hypothetical protein
MPEFVKAEEVLDEKGKAQVQYFPRFAEDGTYLMLLEMFSKKWILPILFSHTTNLGIQIGMVLLLFLKKGCNYFNSRKFTRIQKINYRL